VDGDKVASPASTVEQALADVLLVQVDAPAYAAAIECSDRVGGGLMLTGEKALAIAEYVLDHHQYRRPVLIDRARYAGGKRRFATGTFDASWITRQRRLGLSAILPDVGYVGQDDEPGLVSILTRVADLGPGAVAPLALHLSWLNAKANLGRLTDHVQSAGVPIALALEHEKDPLSARYAIDGLITLLELPIPVIMLRCDVSAIGALSFGATAAAVGTTTGLRHIYPLPKPDASGGFGGGPKPAAVVRGCLAYASLDKIDQAVQADRDNLLWACSCRVCAGRTLDWLGSAPDPETAAFQHSLETLYQIRRDLLGREERATGTQRRQSWIAQCDSAMFQHLDIQSTIYQWEPPRALGNWAARRKQEFTQPSMP
jgi:hypothetical protein